MKIKKLILGRINNNTYIISNENSCIVIDPSMEYKKIIGYIKENDLKVEAILITHAHFDHVYSLYELVMDTGAPVYMHEDDFWLYEKSVEKLRTKKVDVQYPLKGGETLELIGEKIEVIHVPGHAEGCVCYIIDDNMFTGDFIFKGSVGRTDLPTSNQQDMNESLKKFTKIDRDLKIFCGHGDNSSYYEEMNNNPFLTGLK